MNPNTFAQEAKHVDADSLASDLRSKIKGEVRFDEGSRALYATDGSNYRQVPIGVVIPRSTDDIVETIQLCHEYSAPILSRGGGTSLAGQCCNVAVVMDMSKYLHEIIELNPEKHYARVQPGIVLDRLREAAEKHNLTFGPDPATHRWCTLGGMIGNNSCGVHSVMAGRTADNIEELEIVTYRGARMRVGKTSEEEFARIIKSGGPQADIYSKLRDLRDRYADLIRERYPRIPRRVSGYNLDELLPENGFHVARALVGSESTCITVLEAKARLVPSPPSRSLVVLGYENIFSAADHVMDVLAHKPIGLEGLDRKFVDDLRKKGLQEANLSLFPSGHGYLLVEFGGDTKEESDDKARKMMDDVKGKSGAPSMKLFDKPDEEAHIWSVREAGLGATAHIPGQKENWEGWEDSAVAPEKVPGYLRDIDKLLTKYGYYSALYGHFGDGCLHMRIDFDLKTAAGIRKYRSFIEEASDLVVSYHGSLSGEHGDGQSRAEMLPKMFGPELIVAFQEFKSIWDPDWKMNPGKVVNPYKIDENLRYGSHYDPPEVKTHFHYPGDKFSFAKATERCVGVGACRKTDSGTMCPSYMVTREEMHATRGRAHLLFEMMRGNPLKNQWRNDHVHDALDLCLACKGCKGECPVHVDMATYKAEFLSHYYKRRLRPRSAYAFGLIYWWARIGSCMPRLTNFFLQTPFFAGINKFIAGMAPERKIPKFGNQTFKDWFKKRKSAKINGPKVILWPDTFNNHFHPDIAQSAVKVLESLGRNVVVPEISLCCGRPLYDFGMLDLAKHQLRQILDYLKEDIEAGTPIVGLEPSCVAVFRDELQNLFPHDQNAMRLGEQVFTLAEYLTKHLPEDKIPELHRKAVLHGHCHEKAILNFNAEQQLLKKMKIDLHVVDSGCCGMAGSFGFEKGEHYDVSIKAGERVLLPAVRSLDSDVLIIADGFSCHEQISQCTGKIPLHTAQVLEQALHSSSGGNETAAS